MAKNAIKWSGTMTATLKQADSRNRRAIGAAAKYIATASEKHMRSNAPWTDRTGNARAGLHATVQGSGNTTAVILYHSVPYGIWLETRWSGRYAIINPTIEVMAPKFIDMVGRLIFK